jgi:hypothetical protein
LEAQPAQDDNEVSLRICSRDIGNTSFLDLRFEVYDLGDDPTGARLDEIVNRKSYIVNEVGGEGTNRTYLDLRSKPTAVLKTAEATRHPSLSD